MTAYWDYLTQGKGWVLHNVIQGHVHVLLN